jgi:signal transduction histidine kinase
MVILGVRMIGQERELAEKRLHDEQLRVTGQLRQELSSRLERMALQEVAAFVTRPDRALSRSYDHPDVVLVARVVEGRLVLPWDEDSRPNEARRLIGEEDFAQRVSQGEDDELVGENLQGAVHFYRQALEAAHHPVQTAYVQLLMARALGPLGHDREALIHTRAVLTSPPDLVDEHGMPFSLYAAVRLLQEDTDHESVLECLQRQVETPGWSSPPALHLMRRLLMTLKETDSGVAAGEPREEDPGIAAEDDGEADFRIAAGEARKADPGAAPGDREEELERTISVRIQRAEQALALQRDWANLRVPNSMGPRTDTSNVTWIPYGTPTWLVAEAPSGWTQQAVAVAVSAEGILASLNQDVAASGEMEGRVTVVGNGDQEVELLGPGFPGLGVVFPPGQRTAFHEERDGQQRFYLGALALVVGTTLFSAYLLWRDVNREVQLAEMRSHFVSAVSHELKTPLATIRMFADTLRMGRPSREEAKAEYLDTIVNESERLSRLLNNVLDFSRIERGTKTYNREPHSLSEILRSTVRAMEYPAEQHGFQIHVHMEEGVPPVPVDRDAIEQAILNLLANAMKYSGDSRDIDLRLKRAHGQAVVEVADRGVGIEEEERERIFQQFHRIQSTENQQISGTGLGLTLVRHIVEGHRGYVTVDSAVGEGSTFAIHLPLEADEP